MILLRVIAFPNVHSAKCYLIPEKPLLSRFAVYNFMLHFPPPPPGMASLNPCSFQLEHFSTVSIFHNTYCPLNTSILKFSCRISPIGHFTQIIAHILRSPDGGTNFCNSARMRCASGLLYCWTRKSQGLSPKHSYYIGHFSMG